MEHSRHSSLDAHRRLLRRALLAKPARRLLPAARGHRLVHQELVPAGPLARPGVRALQPLRDRLPALALQPLAALPPGAPRAGRAPDRRRRDPGHERAGRDRDDARVDLRARLPAAPALGVRGRRRLDRRDLGAHGLRRAALPEPARDPLLAQPRQARRDGGRHPRHRGADHLLRRLGLDARARRAARDHQAVPRPPRGRRDRPRRRAEPRLQRAHAAAAGALLRGLPRDQGLGVDLRRRDLRLGLLLGLPPRSPARGAAGLGDAVVPRPRGHLRRRPRAHQHAAQALARRLPVDRALRHQRAAPVQGLPRAADALEEELAARVADRLDVLLAQEPDRLDPDLRLERLPDRRADRDLPRLHLEPARARRGSLDVPRRPLRDGRALQPLLRLHAPQAVLVGRHRLRAALRDGADLADVLGHRDRPQDRLGHALRTGRRRPRLPHHRHDRLAAALGHPALRRGRAHRRGRPAASSEWPRDRTQAARSTWSAASSPGSSA